MAGTGSTLFSVGLFWRQLRFDGNWLHIIFGRIVLEAAQIWQELAQHYLPAPMLMPEFSYQGIFPRASWWTAYQLGCNKSKVRCRQSNQWPDDCTFFPVVICNLIKEPAKKHSSEPAKTIQAHGTNPPNIATDGQTTVHFFPVLILLRNPLKQSELMEAPNILTDGQMTVPFFQS